MVGAERYLVGQQGKTAYAKGTIIKSFDKSKVAPPPAVEHHDMVRYLYLRISKGFQSHLVECVPGSRSIFF